MTVHLNESHVVQRRDLPGICCIAPQHQDVNLCSNHFASSTVVPDIEYIHDDTHILTIPFTKLDCGQQYTFMYANTVISRSPREENPIIHNKYSPHLIYRYITPDVLLVKRPHELSYPLQRSS